MRITLEVNVLSKELNEMLLYRSFRLCMLSFSTNRSNSRRSGPSHQETTGSDKFFQSRSESRDKIQFS